MTREEAIKELKIQFLGEYDRQREAKNIAIKALEQEPILDKIRAEIEKAIWEDILPLQDEAGVITDEIRIPLLNPDDVFEIIDKYKAESEGKEEKNEKL